VFRATTYRSNLRLFAKSFKSGAEKQADLTGFLRKNGGSTIVYVQTHDQTDTVCKNLKKDGFNAHGYHAGMSSDVRTAVQEKFMASEDVVVSGLNVLSASFQGPKYSLGRSLLLLPSGWASIRPTYETLSTLQFPKA